MATTAERASCGSGTDCCSCM